MENYRPATGVQSVADERHDEMDAYDRLPPLLRALLREAPVEVSAVQTLSRYRHDGIQTTIKRIERALSLYLAAAS